MPSLTYANVQEYSKIPTSIFVETGTYFGETIDQIQPYYNTVYSIELSDKFANYAKRKFAEKRNVTIFQGDSSDVLKTLCPTFAESPFFWLDGHWSGDSTAKGSKDVPLLEELDSIMTLCKPSCVVAIDDVRLFNTNKTEDWTNITREHVLDIVQSRLSDVSYYPSALHPEDRMVLTLKDL
jgi:hypothetical protein